jgi:hypothetical protein
MKRPILITAIIILTVGLCYLFYERFGFAEGVRQDTIRNLKWQQQNTAIYFVDLPGGLDTMDFKASITLDTSKQIHKLKLPNGGTETNVLIYDSTYLTIIQRNTLPKVKPLTHGDFNNDQEVLLDISALRRGKYYVHYLSCGLGGIFLLTIN